MGEALLLVTSFIKSNLIFLCEYQDFEKLICILFSSSVNIASVWMSSREFTPTELNDYQKPKRLKEAFYLKI